MWTNTKYQRGAANVGNRVAGAPTFAGAGYVSYAVPAVPGLRLGVDAKYTGNTKVRPTGGLQTGGYLLVNAGASYATRIAGHDVTLRAAVDNLFNRRYWMFRTRTTWRPAIRARCR